MSKFGMYNRFPARACERDRVVEILLRAAALMEGVDGCELYLVNTSPDNIDAVWVTEVWDSEESHGASLSIEGVAPLGEHLLPLLTASPEKIRVVPVGGKGWPDTEHGG